MGHFVPGDQGHKGNCAALRLPSNPSSRPGSCRSGAPALLVLPPSPSSRPPHVAGQVANTNDEEHYNILRDDTNHHVRRVLFALRVSGPPSLRAQPVPTLRVLVTRYRSRNVGMYAAQARARGTLLEKETTPADRRRVTASRVSCCGDDA